MSSVVPAQVVAPLRAFLALGRKGWLTRRRTGLFYSTIAVYSFLHVLPVLLNARALAGPDESQVARFAQLAGTENYLAFATVGIVATLWTGIATQDIAEALRGERLMGTLGVTWLAQAPRALLIAGSAAGLTLANSLLGLSMFGAAWLIYRFGLTPQIPGLIAVIVPAYAASMALGVLFAGFVLRYRESGRLLALLLAAAGILAGIAYPPAVLPGWAQAIGQVFPLTWTVRGLRAALVFGEAPDAYLSAGVLVAMTAGYGVLAWYGFSRLERAARRHGLLEVF